MADDDLSDSRCIKCKQDCLENYYNCDSCLNRIHKGCININPSEVKCMPLQKRVLFLICDECKIFIGRMPFMMKLIEEMRRDIETIKTEIKSSSKIESYASVLQNNQIKTLNNKTPLPSIIIKPRVVQNLQKSKKEIQNTINPANLNIGIRNFKETKQGNIVVKCDTEREIERFKEEVEKKLNGKFQIELPKKISPKIKIVGYTGDESLENVEAKIRNQNKWIDTHDHLKVTYIRQLKNEQRSVIYAECSGKLLNKILNYRKVCIDWERLPVYEDLTVSRCYNCQGFNHKSNKCTKDEVCGNCAGNHSTSECDQHIKMCINCKVANDNYKLQLNTDHIALDKECPSLKFHIGLLRSKTDYNL